MRHPLASDLVWIDDVLDDWPCTLRWDIKGHTPPAPALASRLWDGVVTQRVSTDDTGQPTGLLQLVDLDLLNGTARIEILAPDPERATPAWKSFVAEVLDDFPLRFAHTFAVADGFDIAAMDPTAREVGRLREHHLRGRGRYEDVVIHEVDMRDRRRAL